ncbi:hypothetical protein J19TS2_25970 [Cohnella xylanilytica]|uniref:hypothetical protein n=1 Tax=Cohnella xylanilytica TaxID=557555 RepID=UPI001B0E65F1|nr:hypothetical protein [Cohnella xylanilytica]GIO13042.1 hypothetical protein J19TS2_25970 [Cohnella xylanilytica]
MEIGRKIYYDKSTGNTIIEIGERSGDVVETTQEGDFAAYVALQERVPGTVGVLQLEYGQFAQDFAECSGYRVDVSGDEPTLQFSYPEGNEEPEEPVFQTPLSEQVKTLKTTVEDQQQTIDDLTLAIADILGT